MTDNQAKVLALARVCKDRMALINEVLAPVIERFEFELLTPELTERLKIAAEKELSRLSFETRFLGVVVENGQTIVQVGIVNRRFTKYEPYSN